MKIRALIITILAFSIVAAGAGLVWAHGSFGGGMGNMMGGFGYSPMMNMNGYGPMMYRNGFTPMMGSGAYGDGGCWDTPREDVRNEITTPEKAGDMVAFNLERSNDRLKVGKVTETEDGYEVQVVTRKGEALVDRLLVEQGTGRIYRIYDK